MWARLETLRLETDLLSLQERIFEKKIATIISMIIISPDLVPVRRALVIGLAKTTETLGLPEREKS